LLRLTLLKTSLNTALIKRKISVFAFLL